MISLHSDRTLCVQEIVGASVLTRYNNMHYRVDDIDFDADPHHTFKNTRGEMQSYLEYYQEKWGIRDITGNQPLLIHRIKVAVLIFLLASMHKGG